VLMEQHERWKGARSRLGISAPRRPHRAIPPPGSSDIATPDQIAAPAVEPPVINLLTPPSWLTITCLVARKHGVTLADIVGERRSRKIVAARWEALYLVSTHMRSLSLVVLGRLFKRDHTTILYAVNKYRERVVLSSRSNPNIRGKSNDDTHTVFRPVFPANNTMPNLRGLDTQKALEPDARTGAAG
jgi:hypothetical protein